MGNERRVVCENILYHMGIDIASDILLGSALSQAHNVQSAVIVGVLVTAAIFIINFLYL